LASSNAALLVALPGLASYPPILPLDVVGFLLLPIFLLFFLEVLCRL